MYGKFNLAAALLALGIFAHAQHQGWNLFDNVATPHGGSGAGSRGVYHK